jgi:hypothetical protein
MRHDKYSESFSAGVSGKLAHRLRPIAHAFTLEKAHGESSETSHVLWRMTFGDAAAVFVVIPVQDRMATVFNAPVLPVILKYLCGTGLLLGFYW